MEYYCFNCKKSYKSNSNLQKHFKTKKHHNNLKKHLNMSIFKYSYLAKND